MGFAAHGLHASLRHAPLHQFRAGLEVPLIVGAGTKILGLRGLSIQPEVGGLSGVVWAAASWGWLLGAPCSTLLRGPTHVNSCGLAGHRLSGCVSDALRWTIASFARAKKEVVVVVVVVVAVVIVVVVATRDTICSGLPLQWQGAGAGYSRRRGAEGGQCRGIKACGVCRPWVAC